MGPEKHVNSFKALIATWEQEGNNLQSLSSPLGMNGVRNAARIMTPLPYDEWNEFRTIYTAQFLGDLLAHYLNV
jgi:hypothetical protein